MIRNSVFEPATFNTVVNAFEGGWALTRYLFVGQPQSMIDDARLVLAQAILNTAQAGHTETDVLRHEGIRALKVAYPHISI